MDELMLNGLLCLDSQLERVDMLPEDGGRGNNRGGSIDVPLPKGRGAGWTEPR